MCFECRVLGAVVSVTGKIGSDVFHPAQQQQQQQAQEGGHSTLSLHACARLSFHPTLEQVDAARDESAEVYLADTLAHLSSRGLYLVPIKVDSDGSCMPHAISRSMVGKEVLFNVLRLALQRELVEHAEWYKSKFQQGMDEDTWTEHWRSICEEAAPTAGRASGRWLGPGEHLVGLANVLRRPILLLDRWDLMQTRDDHSCGMFLPLRHEQSASLTTTAAAAAAGTDERTGSGGEPGDSDGLCAGPLIIAWANASHNHFVSLMVPDWRREIEEQPHTVFAPRHADALLNECTSLHPELWADIKAVLGLNTAAAAVGGNLAESNGVVSKVGRPKVRMVVPAGRGPGDVCLVKDSATGNEVAIQVPVGKMEGDEFFWTPPAVARLDRALGSGGGGGNDPKADLVVALAQVFLCNWPTAMPASREGEGEAAGGRGHRRAALKRSCAVLAQVLGNLVDALTCNFAQLERHRKLKLSNGAVVKHVVQVPGARRVLEAIGMAERNMPDGDSSSISMSERYLYFIHDQPTAEIADALVIAKRAVELMRDACCTSDSDNASDACQDGGDTTGGELFRCDFVVAAGQESHLFGAKPVLCDLSWEQARKQYGGSKRYGGACAVALEMEKANGQASNTATSARMVVVGSRNAKLEAQAKQELALFYAASRAAFEAAVAGEAPQFSYFPWDDAVRYSERVGTAQCGSCGVSQMWRTDIDSLLSEARVQRCQGCQADVTVSMTGQRRIETFVYDWTEAQRLKQQQQQQQQQQHVGEEVSS